MDFVIRKGGTNNYKISYPKKGGGGGVFIREEGKYRNQLPNGGLIREGLIDGWLNRAFTVTESELHLCCWQLIWFPTCWLIALFFIH